MMETGLYLFCFARRDLAAAPAGAAVERFAAACAVVAEVPLAEYCSPDAESRLQDLAWLGPRACRHEQVVEEVMSDSPVLPARFGAIFSTRARLEEFVQRHEPAISEFLDRVAGQEEWAVKGVLDRSQARESACAEELTGLEALPPGRRHLEERKRRAKAATGLHRWVLEAGQAVVGDLQPLVSAFSERRIVAAAPAEVVFNWAFLLPREQRAPFRAKLERANAAHAGKGLGFTLSGPWPAYSFVPELSMKNDA